MLCRLCLIESTELFNIFEDDGARFKIADIISQHFWFVPKKDDHLSNICCTCWLKVDSFHQFYCFIQDAQKNLSEISLTDRESLPEATRDHIKNENDDNDELKYVTAVSEYTKTIQNNFETDDIIIKSENCDNAELRHDKIEKVEDPKDIDNTNQINDTDSKIVSTTYSNDNNLITSCKNKTSSPKTRSKTSDKKRQCNASDNEEDLPLTYFRQNRPKRNKNEKSKSEHLVEHKPKRYKKKEKSEYLEKNKENDDIIAKYITLRCEICYEELTTFTQIVQHYRTKHDTKGYVVCFCCGKKLYKKYLLLDHINKYLNSEYFKCNKCDKTFADRKGLKGHISRHYSDNSKTFECDNCSKKFMSKILLSQHKLIHIPPEERQFLCDDCGKAFATNYLLMAHHRHIHKNESGKMCHICAKVIHGKSLFEKHQLEHAGIVESGIQCNKCGARLKNKFSLKRHMYLLHNESLTAHKKCEICEKLFKTQDALRHHIKYVHESNRKYQCEICDKAFKVERSLKEHIATHTGEILYTCPHCPKTFNSNANMHSHRKKKHRKEWEETRKDHCVRVLPAPHANGVTTDLISKDNKNVSNETNVDSKKQNFNSLVLD